MSGQIYFVAGATRGIGLALVNSIVSKDPSAIVYAGARDPTSGAAQLKELVTKYPGRVEIVKYIAGDKKGSDAIAAEIKAKHGRVDTVIANAAIANFMGEVHETPVDKYQEHLSINVLGPIVLFQSFRDVLKASAQPRFIAISSIQGSLAAMEALSLGGIGLGVSTYGMSKVALNWITRKIHFENEWLVAFAQCPGAVETDMSRPLLDAGNATSEFLKTIMRKPDVAADIMVDIFTTSTREKNGGQFLNTDGGTHPW